MGAGVWAKPVFLLVSLGVLLACVRLAQPEAEPSGMGDRTVEPAGGRRGIPLAVLGCIVLPFIYALVSRTVLETTFEAELYGAPIELVVMFVTAAAAGLMVRSRGGAGIEAGIVICDVAFSTGMLLLAVFGIHTLPFTGALIQSGFFLFNALLWMYVVLIARGNVQQAIVLFGLVDGTLYLFALLGRLVGVALGGLWDTVADPLFVSIWVLAMLLLVLFIFERKRGVAEVLANASEQPDSAPAGDPFLEGCQRLGAAGGLSARELEIMVAYARGRSASFIAQDLNISLETVKTHLKHIYAKLDVHNRQELLDLVDRAPQR